MRVFLLFIFLTSIGRAQIDPILGPTQRQSVFGNMNVNWAGMNGDLGTLEQLHSLNIKTIRMDIAWPFVDSNPTLYLSNLDSFIKRANALGISILAGFTGVPYEHHPLPAFCKPALEVCRPGPGKNDFQCRSCELASANRHRFFGKVYPNLRVFQSFAETIVKRYSVPVGNRFPNGRIDYFSTPNEPYGGYLLGKQVTQAGWPTRPIDPANVRNWLRIEDLIDFIRVLSHVVHQPGSVAKLVGPEFAQHGGTFPGSWKGVATSGFNPRPPVGWPTGQAYNEGQIWLDWMQAILEAFPHQSEAERRSDPLAKREYLDVVAWHVYPGPNSASISRVNLENHFLPFWRNKNPGRHYRPVRGRPTPLWFTEVGNKKSWAVEHLATSLARPWMLPEDGRRVVVPKAVHSFLSHHLGDTRAQTRQIDIDRSRNWVMTSRPSPLDPKYDPKSWSDENVATQSATLLNFAFTREVFGDEVEKVFFYNYYDGLDAEANLAHSFDGDWGWALFDNLTLKKKTPIFTAFTQFLSPSLPEISCPLGSKVIKNGAEASAFGEWGCVVEGELAIPSEAFGKALFIKAHVGVSYPASGEPEFHRPVDHQVVCPKGGVYQGDRGCVLVTRSEQEIEASGISGGKIDVESLEWIGRCKDPQSGRRQLKCIIAELKPTERNLAEQRWYYDLNVGEERIEYPSSLFSGKCDWGGRIIDPKTKACVVKILPKGTLKPKINYTLKTFGQFAGISYVPSSSGVACPFGGRLNREKRCQVFRLDSPIPGITRAEVGALRILPAPATSGIYFRSDEDGNCTLGSRPTRVLRETQKTTGSVGVRDCLLVQLQKGQIPAIDEGDTLFSVDGMTGKISILGTKLREIFEP